MPSRTFAVPAPLDLVLTLSPLRVGRYDATIRLAPHEAWRAVNTPLGPGTLRLETHGTTATATGWGPGGGWLLDQAPAAVGVDDRPERLVARDRVVQRAAHRTPGVRLGRSGLVADVLVPTILAQKVTGLEAQRAWTRLVRWHGQPAPGPDVGLRLPPTPAALASLPYEAYHPAGVERRRADTIRRACSRIDRLEEAGSMPRAEAWQRLTALPGLGPWTAAIILRTAFGDPDAVEVGDFHLPNLVSWNLAGEPRADDARMLELLEPYVGQRGRVVRLLELAGQRAPSYGPRLAPRRVESL